MWLKFARSVAAIAVTVGLALTAAQAWASAATDIVNTLNSNTLRIMQNARALGFDGRYREFEPILTRTFDMPLMAQLAIGRKWTELTSQQQAKVVDTFRRYTVALYASRFDSYSNQRFEILGEQATEGNTVLVRNRFIKSNGEAVGINYRVRNNGGKFQAFDVYLNEAISEIAVRRSEFTSVLIRQGVDALLSQLEERIVVIKTESIAKANAAR